MTLDDTDIRMALVAASYYRRAHILCKRPVPAAADRLINHLTHLAANGQDSVAAQPHWLTTRQAAELLGCSDRTARRIAARVGRRVGREWLIPVDAISEERGHDDGS
jgi:excisionase family DNA binding protein